MKRIVTLLVCLAIGTLFAMLLFYLPALAQSQPSSQAKDPGVRAGSVNAGQALSTLSPSQSQFFSDGQTRFNQVEQVATGLGPTFNSNSCASCHAQPSVGGTSPGAEQFPNVGPNPQLQRLPPAAPRTKSHSLSLRTALCVRRASRSSSLQEAPSPERRTAVCTRCSRSPGAATPGAVLWRNPTSSKWQICRI